MLITELVWATNMAAVMSRDNTHYSDWYPMRPEFKLQDGPSRWTYHVLVLSNSFSKTLNKRKQLVVLGRKGRGNFDLTLFFDVARVDRGHSLSDPDPPPTSR